MTTTYDLPTKPAHQQLLEEDLVDRINDDDRWDGAMELLTRFCDAGATTIHYRGVDVPLAWDGHTFTIGGVAIGGVSNDDMVRHGIVEAALRADGRAGTLDRATVLWTDWVGRDVEETFVFDHDRGGWVRDGVDASPPFETLAATGAAAGHPSYRTSADWARDMEDRNAADEPR